MKPSMPARRPTSIRAFTVMTALLLVLGLSGVLPPAPLAHAQGLDAATVERIKDAVVLIDVTLTAGEGRVEASGSGFVISPRGEIVTNAHVVSMTTEDDLGQTLVGDDREVSVTFHPGTGDEESFPAEVLRENHDLDLALLQIEQDTPTYLDLADSDAVPETATIYACGHPLGLREISIRTGSVTAHRTWEGRRFIEHDASAEEGNSGGPVVLGDSCVVGVHTLTLVSSGMLTKFAIPSSVVSDWLAAPPSEDPAPPIPGMAVRELLDAANLTYEEAEPGIFTLPWDNGVTIRAHQYEDFLRLHCPLGELPGTSPLLQGYCALEALRFNYSDPVGRLSVMEDDDGALLLHWECQVPMSSATPDYTDTIARVGARQVERWQAVLRAEDPDDPTELYPGGDADAQMAQLKGHLENSELVFEEEEGYFKLPYDNDVVVFARIFRGVVYTHAYTGGMPGETRAEQGEIAIKLLKRNWNDPLGRLALDSDNDLVWESQVPTDFITPDYLAILSATAATQVGDFIETYGDIPLNG